MTANGQGSAINIHFGAFTGANPDIMNGVINPNPNRGGIYFGTERGDVSCNYWTGSHGTVKMTATDGGSIFFDDQGKSSLGGFVESWVDDTRITVSDKSSFKVNAMFRTFGSTTLNISGGSTASFGYEYYTQSYAKTLINVDGAGSKMSVAQEFWISDDKDVYNITNGGVLEIGEYCYFSSGNKTHAGATINVDGSGSLFSIDDATHKHGLYLKGGKAVINMTDGGRMETKYVDNQRRSGESYEYDGEVYLTVSGKDSQGVASAAVVSQTYTNQATTGISVANGGVVSIAEYINDEGASTTINLGALPDAATPSLLSEEDDAPSTFSAHVYKNNGTTMVNVAAGAETSAHFDELWLVSGEMVVAGRGSYALGEAATEGERGMTYFHVTGRSAADAVSTSIDATELANFSVGESAAITLVFTPELQTSVEAGDTMTLTLVQGYDGFTLSDQVLSGLLASTTYVSVSGETYTDFSIANASYRMDGNNLVWTNAPAQAVPEPATATLSLLALAALAARRRRR